MKTFSIFFILLTTISYGYQWPIADVNDQHIIWGNYGEVRSEWVEDPWQGYWIFRDHIHDGIDIDKEGNPLAAVYPVVSGIINGAVSAGAKTIYVRGEDGYDYTYHHLESTDAWQDSTPVTAGSTILGDINTGESTHLHFVDGILNQNTYNPLFFISPFEDLENPVIEYVKVVLNLGDDDETPAGLSVISYNEKVDIIVRARDVISLPYQINNSVYFVNTSIFDPDSIEIANFNSLIFWTGGNNGIWDVKKIYAEGSKASYSITGVYLYISTNNLNSDNYWLNTVEKDGYYTILVVVRDEMWNEDSKIKTIWVEGSAKIEEKKH